MSHDRPTIDRAVQDFHQAHRRAALQEMMARFTGESTKLLSFNEVSEKLKTAGGIDKGLQEIPLAAIVGSCDRYEDFNRTFLPLQMSDKERWTRVRAYVAKKGLANIPPIMVYQIGQVYFVADGNHRVSIARQLEATHIRATVTELQAKVDLSPTDRPDDLILKAEYADFLERTNLDASRPAADLRVTVPGKYWILEAQIEAHCYLAAETPDQPLSFHEAAAYWYDGVYLGVVQVIRERGLLRDFPQRTETDLYLWAFEHRASLKESLDWEMGVGTVLTELKVQPPPQSPESGRLSHLKERLRSPKRSAQARTGQWQLEKLARPDQSRLFFNVLVALTGETQGWRAFEQALEIARRERGRLRGLHLLARDEDKGGSAAQALRADFEARCQAANVRGQLALERGPAVDKICERAWLADIVVAPLLNPPGTKLMTRLSSEFRTLVQRCARPILAVPDHPSPLTQALLAYDGSPKAREALFVATYIAGRWGVPLLVLTVAESSSADPSAMETEARNYLDEQGVEAHFVHAKGSVAEAVLAIADAYGADLIIMGSYSRRPLKNLVLGDSVDEVLTRAKQPILICR